MHIFTEPDATKYPDNFSSTKCSGLEQLTGADMVISKLPIPPTVNLQAHIANRALFVQIKIGYDICSFDQLHAAIARVQKAQIPKNQAILLFVGKDKAKIERMQGSQIMDDAKFYLEGQKVFGDTDYKTFIKLKAKWRARGGVTDSIPDMSYFQMWVNAQFETIEDIEKEGKRDIYPPKTQFTLDDIWQSVEEIKDWRCWLVSGLDGFGSKTAQSVMEYAEKTIPKHQFSAYHVLCLMTDEDDKGKPFHKIPGWGDKSRRSFRELLGLTPGWNLGELTYHYAYWQGWQAFGRDFADLVNKKKTPKEAHTQLMCKDFISIENEIPF